MSQPPPNWPPQPSGNPFADQPPQYGPGAPYPGAPHPGGPYPGPYGPPQRIEDDPAMRWVIPVGTSGWAIAAGYLGLFSLLCLPGPLALFCGVMAILQLRRNPRMSGWGRAILGLVLGSVGTLILLMSLLSGVAQALFGK
jgi:hypothetical protein